MTETSSSFVSRTFTRQLFHHKSAGNKAADRESILQCKVQMKGAGNWTDPKDTLLKTTVTITLPLPHIHLILCINFYLIMIIIIITTTM